MLTAEQKVRQLLTGNPLQDPHFQHEDPNIIRWITGGTMPDGYVTLKQQSNEIIARCPICQQNLGQFDASYTGPANKQIAAIRERSHQHQQKHKD